MSDGAAFPSPARPPDRGPAWGRMPRSVALALAALLRRRLRGRGASGRRHDRCPRFAGSPQRSPAGRLG